MEKSFAMHLKEAPQTQPIIFRVENLLIKKDNTITRAVFQHYTRLQVKDVAGMDDWLDAMQENRFYWQCEGCHLHMVRVNSFP
jgi:hypothetical protein